MIDNFSILETALAIRPQLSQLLGNEAGEQMRQELDQLLQQFQAGESIENSIWELLTNKRATRTWVTQFQQKDVTQKGLNRLPGNISDISAPEFKCPQCEYTWSSDRVGRPTPLCKVHKVPLKPASP
ncbi:hypothetical protein [Nostoc sp. GT001]|uniref:hypothetical protein n=1 Tax=Nostoc sp. GT001 TaxID=3056647 RepID=UPI0025AB5BA7|nr:hypothetical protein [Nostoc sp. GT001]MDM9584868.1 hypothetical protein [Nostoc sp. GT001]